jgi:hypothetical protein
MRLFEPGALWFSLLIPLLVLMYILKQRFEEKEVSSLYLWHQVIMDTEATSPFQKLRNNILFFLQLLILLLAIFALTNPFVWWNNKNYENVVMVIDTSGSMSALGEKETRLEEAKKRAEDMVNSLSSGSRVTLISSSRNSKVEVSGTTDKKEVINKIKALEETNSAGNIEDVYSLVKAISNQYESYKVTYFSDRNIDLKELNGEVVNVAVPRNNVSLDYIAHSRFENGLKVMIRATNHGVEKTTAEICLYGEDKLISVKDVELNAGETKTLYFDGVPLESKYLYGEITQKDGLNGDNTIYSIVKQKDSRRVLLSTEQNVFLEKVLGTVKDIDLYKTSPGQVINEDFDLYIFDNTTGTEPKKGNVLYINPQKDTAFFKVGAEIAGDSISVSSHAVTKYMESADFAISKAKDISVPYWGTALMKLDDKAIAFAGEQKGQKIGVIGFDLHNSDLPLTPEFPIFINNIISYLMDRDTLTGTQYNCGDNIEIVPLPEAEKLYVTEPSKQKTEISSKYPVKPFDRTYTPGIYEVSQKVSDNEISKLLAVNFPTSESDINVEASSSGDTVRNETSRGGINLKNYLIILALLFLILEWITYVKIYGHR